MVLFHELKQVLALREHTNKILVYGTMLPFNLIHSTDPLLYLQNTSKNLKFSRVIKIDQWHDICQMITADYCRVSVGTIYSFLSRSLC